MMVIQSSFQNKMAIISHVSYHMGYLFKKALYLPFHCIPGRKSGLLRIQYGHAAAAAEISFWMRKLNKYFS